MVKPLSNIETEESPEEENFTIAPDEGNEDLSKQLWPDSKNIFSDIEEERDYTPPKYQYNPAEEKVKNIGKELKEALKDPSIEQSLEFLEKTDQELFRGRWNGEEVITEGFYYSDSPLESGDYCNSMKYVFIPTLHKIEEIVSEEDTEVKLRVIEKLAEYVKTNYRYDTWYFNRAAEITTTMLKIGGTKALSAVKEVAEFITTISEDQKMIYEEDEDYDYEISVEDLYEPVFLEFEEPEHRQFTHKVTKAIADYPWKEGEEKTAAKFLTEYLSINSEGNLQEYVRSFEKLGVENSVSYLLKNIRSEDVLTRRMSAEILYRLELGKIGVSEQGVKYLGKLYDLGKYNDPDFFVRRLNNSGLIGVLSEKEGNIKGVFPLDIESEQESIDAEVRQLMSEELFLPKADETEQEREQREQYLKLFIENYESMFNDEFFKNTGVRLNSLALHEQGWFLLSYLELSENKEELERLRDFSKEYGEYGLKTFLSLEYGGSGNEILKFANNENLSKDEKKEIFKNFYNIANEAFNWRKIFNEIEGSVESNFSSQVHEAFVRKNAEFFKAAQIISETEKSDVTMKELLTQMNTISFALHSLKQIYADDSNLSLEQKPQIQDEKDSQGNIIESAVSSYILNNGVSRIVISVRPNPTEAGEARINFNVTNLKTNERARIGFDLSDYGQYIGEESKPPVVSLDFGVGKPDREEAIWPSQRVGRVLELVEGSEGGHNEASFSGEAAENFPEIANKFKDYIEAKFTSSS